MSARGTGTAVADVLAEMTAPGVALTLVLAPGDHWFMLGQLVSPVEDFEERIFRPALERLFTRLVEPVPA